MITVPLTITFSWNGPFVMLAVTVLILFTLAVMMKRGVDLLPMTYIVPSAVLLGFILSRFIYVSACDALYLEQAEKWNLTDGGYCLLGSMLGAALAAVVCCFIARKPDYILTLFDCAAPGTAIAIAIGRFGSVFTEDCLGVVVFDEKLQHFPVSLYTNSGVYRYAVFFWEAILCLVIAAVLLLMMKRSRRGEQTLLFLMLYCGVRAFLESLRFDSMYVGFVRLSQLAAALVLLAVYVYFTVRSAKFIKYHTLYIVYHVVFTAALVLGFISMFFMGSHSASFNTVRLLISCVLLTACCLAIYYTYRVDRRKWKASRTAKAAVGAGRVRRPRPRSARGSNKRG